METKAVLSLTRRHNLADMYICVAKALVASRVTKDLKRKKKKNFIKALLRSSFGPNTVV